MSGATTQIRMLYVCVLYLSQGITGKSYKQVCYSFKALLELVSSSIAATPGLVDQIQFARASQAISVACQNPLSPNSTQQEVS